MVDTGPIEKRCESETCDNDFEARNKRKRFCSDRCRLEQWERDQGVTMRRVKVRRKPSGPQKPRTNWKKKYLEAEAEIARLKAKLAGNG